MSTFSCKSVSWCWRCGWHFWTVLQPAVAITIINGSRYSIRSYISSRHKSRRSRLSMSIFRCQLYATIIYIYNPSSGPTKDRKDIFHRKGPQRDQQIPKRYQLVLESCRSSGNRPHYILSYRADQPIWYVAIILKYPQRVIMWKINEWNIHHDTCCDVN